eukprot:TRINITY_DN591_c0_g2_i6.p2 TRINITY_DN591_c0_g2~~TRINITY_DN591_c0_g2_i6.p2  ORF type:complete len:225 (+),score=1.62 TRINITY_DN591_c0_g2_i6:44-718(+)
MARRLPTRWLVPHGHRGPGDLSFVVRWPQPPWLDVCPRDGSSRMTTVMSFVFSPWLDVCPRDGSSRMTTVVSFDVSPWLDVCPRDGSSRMATVVSFAFRWPSPSVHSMVARALTMKWRKKRESRSCMFPHGDCARHFRIRRLPTRWLVPHGHRPGDLSFVVRWPQPPWLDVCPREHHRRVRHKPHGSDDGLHALQAAHRALEADLALSRVRALRRCHESRVLWF